MVVLGCVPTGGICFFHSKRDTLCCACHKALKVLDFHVIIVELVSWLKIVFLIITLIYKST